MTVTMKSRLELTGYRRPNEETVLAHRSKIRELMVEKEVYTQKYLEEKRKYDNLLAKVNSNSTLASTSSFLSSHIEAGPSSIPAIQTSEAAQACQQSDVAQHDEPSEKTESSEAAILSSKLKSDDHQEDLDRETLSTGRRLTSDIFLGTAKTHQLPNGSSNTQVAELTRQHEVMAQTWIAATDQQRPRNLEKIAKVAKKVAKGAGYAAVGTIAIIFFPITILVLGRRRRRAGPSMLSSNDTYGMATHPSPHLYQSASLPAELPAIHELSSNSPELDLTSRLARIQYRVPLNE
jgi:hypothetical protein